MTWKNVFITGASSGLGRGLALHYANSGATVFAAARREPQLASLAASVTGGTGKIIPVLLDVGDLDALVSALHQAEMQSGGALDLVIANAGIGAPTDAREMDWRACERIFHTNVSAACVTLAAALPAMVARNSGTVVAVASLAGFRGMPGNSAYCGSKAALRVFMEALRVDLRKTRVKALTVHPGFVRTEMTAKNKFPMPFLMDLDDAVAKMARGIDRSSRKIVFPWQLALGVGWLVSLPDWLYEFVASAAAPGRSKMMPLKKSE